MKRSYSSLKSQASKRLKTKVDSLKTQSSLNFLVEQSKNAFIRYLRLPPIFFKHQLYSHEPNSRTLIDCELQNMFQQNQIRLFHSDFGIMLMFTSDYQLLIEQQLLNSNRLKQHFIDNVLPKSIRLSIEKNALENNFQMNTNDINLLIQSGLLLPKESDQYWFSIPGLAPLVRCVEKGRRILLQMLARRTYREMSMNEFRQRDTKKHCLLGFEYHMHDLIGANLAHIIDTPTGSVVRIGGEKN